MKSLKKVVLVSMMVFGMTVLSACGGGGGGAQLPTFDEYFTSLKDATSSKTMLEFFDAEGERGYARYYYLAGDTAAEISLDDDNTLIEESSYYVIKNNGVYDSIFHNGEKFVRSNGAENEASFINLGRRVEENFGFLLKNKYFTYSSSTKTYTLTTDAALIAEIDLENSTDLAGSMANNEYYSITVKIESGKTTVTETLNGFKTVYTITGLNSTSLTLPTVS